MDSLSLSRLNAAQRRKKKDERSPRHKAADRIAGVIVSLGLDQRKRAKAEKCVNTKSRRKYYRILFSGDAFEGEVNVYSETWILVWFVTRIPELAAEADEDGEVKFVFESEQDTKGFLSRAFKHGLYDEALALPHK